MNSHFVFAMLAGSPSVGGPVWRSGANGTTAEPDRDFAAARQASRHPDQALPRAARWMFEDGNGSSVRHYLALLAAHGKIEGLERFAEANGIECSGSGEFAAAK
jgi:hypothetical protein